MATGPPSTDEVLDTFSDVVLAWDAMLDALRRYSKRAVLLSVTTTIEGVPVMDFPDDRQVDAVLSFSDRFGDNVPEPGPVTWGVSDPMLAEITPDSGDDTKATVKALAGAGTFQITASSGTLNGKSEDLVITPGAAVSESIAVTLEPIP